MNFSRDLNHYPEQTRPAAKRELEQLDKYKRVLDWPTSSPEEKTDAWYEYRACIERLTALAQGRDDPALQDRNHAVTFTR